MAYSLDILQNAKILATYHVDGRPPVFQPGARVVEGRLVLEELGKYSLRVEESTGDVEFSVRIGDLPIGELLPEGALPGGVRIGEHVHWSKDWAPYFESARGATTVHLRSPLLGDAGIDVPAYVVPTKVTEDGLDAMTADVGRLSASLLLDLYGKSQSGRPLIRVRPITIVRSPEEELSLLASVVPSLVLVLGEISRRPASVVQRRSAPRTCWGHERFTPSMTRDIARTGFVAKAAHFPLTMECEFSVESFDVPEHRITAGFLELLVRRATVCRDAARIQAASILSDRPYRDLKIAIGPSLYQVHDAPRIARLRAASSQAQMICATLRKLRSLPILARSKPELAKPRHGVFQRSTEYRALNRLMQSYFVRVPVANNYTRRPRAAKLTSTLFEQWCFLRIVEGFRHAGIVFTPWEEVIQRRATSQFMIDFERGMCFLGVIDPGVRLRIRYQPWILGKDEAISLRESLYRGRERQAAWSPDFVIETQFATSGVWQTRYVIVLDAKYTRDIQPRHWGDIGKYEHIRSVTQSGRQVTKQLWLIHPSSVDAIRCEDPEVVFGPTGPTSSSDELQKFVLQTQPAMTAAPASTSANRAFDRFAAGTLAYLRAISAHAANDSGEEARHRNASTTGEWPPPRV